MENEVVEVGTEVVKGDLIKTAAIVLGIGVIVGIGFGIKKVIEKRRSIKLTSTEPEQIPENSIEE